jgi:hypothetical protein
LLPILAILAVVVGGLVLFVPLLPLALLAAGLWWAFRQMRPAVA